LIQPMNLISSLLSHKKKKIRNQIIQVCGKVPREASIDNYLEVLVKLILYFNLSVCTLYLGLGFFKENLNAAI